ncbi:MAG: hypothetical protein RBS86_04930 [Candidatus Moranbacteria bacterium]|jgi:hypothetical protein|nr:hypothetical protein [Candidatus Moranbacteria bacterium]
MSTNYSVVVESFAERHFIKKFKKKYKKAWDVTQDSLINEFQRMEALSETDVDVISERDEIRIIKTDFRVAGMNKSKKGSGNRCIIAVHRDIKMVRILLVYHKNDLFGNGNETAKWKKVVRENYGDYEEMV